MTQEADGLIVETFTCAGPSATKEVRVDMQTVEVEAED